MALTISQSQAVNNLLRYLLDGTRANGTPVSERDARAAAELLTGGAYKVLAAGITPAQLTEMWQRRLDSSQEDDVATCRLCGCTEDAACEGSCAWVPNPLGIDLCSSCVGILVRDQLADADLIVLQMPEELGVSWPDGSDLLALTDSGIRLHTAGANEIDIPTEQAWELAAHLAAMADTREAATDGQLAGSPETRSNGGRRPIEVGRRAEIVRTQITRLRWQLADGSRGTGFAPPELPAASHELGPSLSIVESDRLAGHPGSALIPAMSTADAGPARAARIAAALAPADAAEQGGAG